MQIKELQTYLEKHGSAPIEQVIRYTIPAVRVGSKFVPPDEKKEPEIKTEKKAARIYPVHLSEEITRFYSQMYDNKQKNKAGSAGQTKLPKNPLNSSI